MSENQEMKWEAGKNTHENVIFSCFGGLSNTGIVSALASLEAVKELGLNKVAIACLGGIPTQVDMVLAKTRAAKKVVTVDGCPKECARKILEQAGIPVSKSIVLARDIGMTKKPLHQAVIENSNNMMDHVSDEDVQKAKALILDTLL